jgi:quercetin dioxygenase-like cupin family protein
MWLEYKSPFPEIITNLPKADIPINGATVYLSQADNHQIVFMEFTFNADVPEHSHADQWETVVSGKVDIVIDGNKTTYSKGDNFFIPDGVKHSAHIYAGFASIAFFNQKDRYKIKSE